MKKLSIFIIVAFLFSCKSEKQPKFQAPLFNNLGSYEVKISTKNKWCQKFFDQGLALTYGFNHAEANRSFKEAARLDTNCAICYWGAALVNGPNINAPMFDSVYKSTFDLVQKAKAKEQYASDKEKALIDALAKRYPSPMPVADRSQFDKDYADAMKEVMQKFPDDDDVAVMTGEALMDLHPWNFWNTDGSPQPWTQEIVDIYEKVLKRDPNHPGANHYYIHTVEASKTADRAVASADRLAALIPGAGHIVHMPSHIYLRVGRYHDAVLANQSAIAADSSYYTQCHSQGFYPLAYGTHNMHFLFVSAAFEGNSKIALQAANDIHHRMMDSSHLFHDPMFGPSIQNFSNMELIALVRFGKWDDVLNYQKPDSSLTIPTAMWHWARCYAYVGKGNLDAATLESNALGAIASDTSLKHQTFFINNFYDLLNIASDMVKGEIAAKKGNADESNKYFTSAETIEDNLVYDEPPDWYFPVRNAHGAALMEHGDYAGAEKVYRDDLTYFINDPWALCGLYQCLEKEGKTDDAAKTKAQFQDMWKYSDFDLKSSRIL
ncbi:MAG: tetratricopeptide repeat protein [Chitinophagales bacterium]